MRILLDECVNQRLRNYLPGHECQSARYAGFGGLKNGELLAVAEAGEFDVLLTVDRGFQYEHNLMGRKIPVIVLSTKSIALKDLLPLVPEMALLLTIKPGEVAKVSARPV
jgi:predicted nuclease of predicted toxin-antitoxin system